MGQFNGGVGKLNISVGIFQLEVAKLNFIHDPLPPKLARLLLHLRLYIFTSFSLSDAME